MVNLNASSCDPNGCCPSFLSFFSLFFYCAPFLLPHKKSVININIYISVYCIKNKIPFLRFRLRLSLSQCILLLRRAISSASHRHFSVSKKVWEEKRTEKKQQKSFDVKKCKRNQHTTTQNISPALRFYYLLHLFCCCCRCKSGNDPVTIAYINFYRTHTRARTHNTVISSGKAMEQSKPATAAILAIKLSVHGGEEKRIKTFLSIWLWLVI